MTNKRDINDFAMYMCEVERMSDDLKKKYNIPKSAEMFYFLLLSHALIDDFREWVENKGEHHTLSTLEVQLRQNMLNDLQECLKGLDFGLKLLKVPVNAEFDMGNLNIDFLKVLMGE